METYQLAAKHHSQWENWQDLEWPILFIAQSWSRTSQFPRTQQELAAINYEEIQQEFERFKKGEFTVQRRGGTLEELWLAITLLSRQFHMCLRNAKEYWPPSRIPQSFITDLLPADIWDYIYHSFKHHREQVANLSLAELKGLPNPSGTLGVFLGDCAHTVTVIGALLDQERIIFYDSWQRGNTRSLLSKGKNTAGIKAVKIDKHGWSINKQELTDSVLSFVTPKASYDYYSNLVWSQVGVGS